MKSILKLTFITSLIFCSQMAIAQTEMTAEKSSEKVTEEIKEIPQIFKDYAWLTDLVNPEDCQGAKLSLRTSTTKGKHKYIVISKDNKNVMYNAKGERYCADHSKLNCQEFYALDEELDSWSCKK